jgi:hypothetical protein
VVVEERATLILNAQGMDGGEYEGELRAHGGRPAPLLRPRAQQRL